VKDSVLLSSYYNSIFITINQIIGQGFYLAVILGNGEGKHIHIQKSKHSCQKYMESGHNSDLTVSALVVVNLKVQNKNLAVKFLKQNNISRQLSTY